MDVKFSVTTSFLAVYLHSRLALFAKNRLKEDDEEFFVLLTALRSAGRRRKHARIQGFVEETVPLYSLSDFKRSFRMSRGTFEVVLEAFANRCEIPQQLDRGGRPPVSVEKHLLITLWFLGNQEPFRSVADRFNVAESCAFKCLRRVCQALKNMAGVFIVWPKGTYSKKKSSFFKSYKLQIKVLHVLQFMRLSMLSCREGGGRGRGRETRHRKGN